MEVVYSNTNTIAQQKRPSRREGVRLSNKRSGYRVQGMPPVGFQSFYPDVAARGASQHTSRKAIKPATVAIDPLFFDNQRTPFPQGERFLAIFAILVAVSSGIGARRRHFVPVGDNGCSCALLSVFSLRAKVFHGSGLFMLLPGSIPRHPHRPSVQVRLPDLARVRFIFHNDPSCGGATPHIYPLLTITLGMAVSSASFAS